MMSIVDKYEPIYPPSLGNPKVYWNGPFLSPISCEEALSEFDIFYGNGFVNSVLDESSPFGNNIEWYEYQEQNTFVTNYDQPIC